MSETSTFEIKSNQFLREVVHWLYCGNSKMQQTMPDAKMVIQLLHGMGFLINDCEPSPHDKPIVDRKGLIVEINNTNPPMKFKMIYPAPEKSSNGASSSGSSSSAAIDNKPVIGIQHGIHLPNLDKATQDVVREVVQLLVEFMANHDGHNAPNIAEIKLKRKCFSLESLNDGANRKMPPLKSKNFDKKPTIIEEEKMTLQNENGNATVSLEEETKDNEPLELKENLPPAPNSGKKVFSPIPDALHKIPLERQKTWVKEPVIGKPADSIICISTPKLSALQRKTDKATCFLSPVRPPKNSAAVISKIKPSCSQPETHISMVSLPSTSKSSSKRRSFSDSSSSIASRRSERMISKKVVNQEEVDVKLRDTRRQSSINKTPTDNRNLLRGESEVTPQKKSSPSSVMGRLFRAAGPSEAPASKKSRPSLLPRSNLPKVTAKKDKTQKKM